jgi:NTE family protein
VHADDFRRGVARLMRWWLRVQVRDVYRADLATLSRHGMRWLADMLGGRPGPDDAAAMLDNSPLGTLLHDAVDFSRLDDRVRDGTLHALSINATSYSTGFAITFFAGQPGIAPWRRMRREGRRAALGHEHLLASTGDPVRLPGGASRRRLVHGRLGADARRRSRPRLHFGARRIVVIAVGQFAGQRSGADAHPGYPSFAQTAGHALSTIFLDNLGADLERLHQINRIASACPADEVAQRGLKLGHVDAFVLAPSKDLGEIALHFAPQLPVGVRTLLRGFGSTRGTGANLTSYLLFQPGFIRALIALGYADAMARREELEAFLAGSAPSFVPLLPPSWLDCCFDSYDSGIGSPGVLPYNRRAHGRPLPHAAQARRETGASAGDAACEGRRLARRHRPAGAGRRRTGDGRRARRDQPRRHERLAAHGARGGVLERRDATVAASRAHRARVAAPADRAAARGRQGGAHARAGIVDRVQAPARARGGQAHLARGRGSRAR